MSSGGDDLKRVLEDPALRQQARALVPARSDVPARRPTAQPPARIPAQPPQRGLQPRATPPTGVTTPDRRPRAPARAPERAPQPATRAPRAPRQRQAPAEETSLAPVSRGGQAVGEEEAEGFPGPETPLRAAPALVPELSGGPGRRANEGGRIDRFHCPVCRMMADLARLDDGPYTVDLWVQTYGGKAGVNIRTDGSDNPTPRGSISYFPAGTPQEAELISARLVEIAEEIIRRAKDGTLVRV